MMLKNIIQELEKRQPFQILFLKDDENQSVEVKEIEEIDLAEIKTHLEQGESIFITRKSEPKLYTRRLRKKETVTQRTVREDARAVITNISSRLARVIFPSTVTIISPSNIFSSHYFRSFAYWSVAINSN